MKIVSWKRDNRKVPSQEPGYMIRVDLEDAIKIINSLTNQILRRTPNSGRVEFVTEDGEYFSISVHEELPKRTKFTGSYAISDE